MSKTGLVRFTETFAEEVRARKIDVNAAAPGSLASDMTACILAAGAASIGEKDITAAQKAEAGEVPAALDKASALCAWLASAASDGISGRLREIDAHKITLVKTLDNAGTVELDRGFARRVEFARGQGGVPGTPKFVATLSRRAGVGTATLSSNRGPVIRTPQRSA